MLRPLCVKCKKEMIVKENEVLALLEYTTGAAGYLGDLYECPHCKRQIITDFGEPIYDRDASKLRKSMKNYTIFEIEV